MPHPIRLLTIFGTRPEAIKLAPLIKALERDKRFDSFICVTGQHRQMLDQMLKFFAITPHHDLNTMKGNQSLHDSASAILTRTRDILSLVRPDRIIVQGDTTSSFASALSAFYERIPVAHVEAGLRSGDIYSPWPEEGNRRLLSHLADLHFAPTNDARKNLLSEGIPEHNICVTGNTVVDALKVTLEMIRTSPDLKKAIQSRLAFLDSSKHLILVTSHRRENFGAALEGLCTTIKKLSQRPDVQVVFPIHMNPKVRNAVHACLANDPNIHLVDPMDYPDFIYTLSESSLILTDSGGVQEEAPSFGVPVLLVRNTTERPEGIRAGTTILTGTDPGTIFNLATKALDNTFTSNHNETFYNPFGDGCATERIISRLMENSTVSPERRRRP